MSSKTKTKSKQDPMKSRPSLELANYGQQLSSILWQKIQNSVTPEVKNMLFVYQDLAEIWDQMATSELDRVPKAEPTRENVMRAITEAEEILVKGISYEHNQTDS